MVIFDMLKKEIDEMAKDLKYSDKEIYMHLIKEDRYQLLSTGTIRRAIREYHQRETTKELQKEKTIKKNNMEENFSEETLSTGIKKEIRAIYGTTTGEAKREFIDPEITNMLEYILKNGLIIEEFADVLKSEELKQKLFDKLDEYKEAANKYILYTEHREYIIEILKYVDSRIGTDLVNTKQKLITSEVDNFELRRGKIDNLRNKIFNGNFFALAYMLKRFENHKSKITLTGYDKGMYETSQTTYYDRLMWLRKKMLEEKYKNNDEEEQIR